MDITITAKVRKSERHASGYYIFVVVNGAVKQPGRNFYKSTHGAISNVNRLAEEHASDMRKFGNHVTLELAGTQ